MDILERRYTPGLVELRVEGEKRRIGGYAIRWMKLSRNLGGFVERVAPSAVNESRGRDWPDVLARFEHDNFGLLGTTAAGTLQLRIDELGLDYDVDPPEARADVVELVGRGDVRHSSFAFRTVGDDGDEWALSEQGYPMRTLLNVQLIDVAPVVSPAYPDATSGLRSLAGRFHADLEEVRKLAQDNELTKFFVQTGPKAEKKKVDARAALMDLRAKEEPPWV